MIIFGHVILFGLQKRCAKEPSFHLQLMHPTRWSALLRSLGTHCGHPAYFIPAMLVANAVDGSRWLSVWSGIATFWQRGHYFLAGIIFCFSLVFPLVKLSLCLICATGAGWLPLKFSSTRHSFHRMDCQVFHAGCLCYRHADPASQSG